MKKCVKVLVIIFLIAFVSLIVWAIIGGEDSFARRILSFIGAVIFSVVGLTVSAVVDHLIVKGGGLPR